MQNNRPWNPEINAALDRIFEAGLVKHLRGRHVSPRFSGGDDPVLVPVPAHASFTLEHVFVAIVVAGVGTAMAIAAFAVELVVIWEEMQHLA